MNWIKKYRTTLVLGLVACLTFIIHYFPLLIEKYYATGIYPLISRSLRWLLGWLPFSVGDVLYGLFFLVMMVKAGRFIKHWFQKKLNKQALLAYGRKLVNTLLVIYIAFNWLWGFNYNRLGSAYQLQMVFSKYSTAHLARLTDTLIRKMQVILHDSATNNVGNIYSSASSIAQQSQVAYSNAATKYPFMKHSPQSLKPEILYSGGNYLGFLGYFNPFTSEAQLNMSIPPVLRPFVSCHEMAHQLGYASESEANFIGYLACKQSTDASFLYSAYLDMYNYAIADLMYRDTALAKIRIQQLPAHACQDRKNIRLFFNQYKNPLNPLIDWAYDKFLKANNQVHGRDSYNEVVGWLVAYANKYGWDAL